MNTILACMLLLNAVNNNTIPLAGKWQFAFDAKSAGAAQEWQKRDIDDTINLPATTETAQKGAELPPTQNYWGLTRRRPFEGQAWYRRSFTVPAEWAGKPASLYVERTKQLTVYVDGGAAIDGGKILSVSHTVPLGRLTAGAHTITLCVNNTRSLWPDRVTASHMLEDSTQTNWNGVLGKIELRTAEQTAIQGIRTNAVGGDPRRLGVRVYLADTVKNPTVHATLTQNGKTIGAGTAQGDSLVLRVAKSAALWDEFTPNLCSLSVQVTAPGVHASWQGTVGLRAFQARDGHIFVNNRRTFLRGKHDACVFPLTGHPPMDMAGWTHYFHVIKAYGLNHIRFHSWCPPEAAFLAADKMGVYLQPELPFWGDPAKPGVEPYLMEEGHAILRKYGHHPSFVMLSLGNEYWGDPLPRPRMVANLRNYDPTRLYDQGSNSESWNPREFAGDDYRVSMFAKRGKDGILRGSSAQDKTYGAGYIQLGVSGTSHTYTTGLEGKTLPFISHEVGQYQVFPNFNETKKYTGVVRADNFDVFKARLTRAGMLDQAEDFRKASGILAAACYREEVEAALRTPEMDGFDLLDLQDYPGQGTALVGILDAFMDSKGLISESDWHSFCSEFVPLALFPKYTWRTDETFTAELRVANYSINAAHGPVSWEMKQDGKIIQSGSVKGIDAAAGGVTTVGAISFPLSSITAPGRVELSVSANGRTNTWPLWVYPPAPASDAPAPMLIRKLDAAAMARLANGDALLYMPAASDIPNSLPGYFTPDFWNYPMFRDGNPPGTMGLLIQDKHPALSEFPTRFYSEWQWQDLAHHSRAVILDGLSNYKPIIQPIDNFDRNHRLGTLFELKVGAGRLLVCAIDLFDKSNRQSPEAQQLMTSLTDYVSSARFQPATEITPNALKQLLEESKQASAGK